MSTDSVNARVGFTITHRRYVDYGRAHYAGNLVDGGFIMGLFSDVATDLCLHLDSDEGLLAGYAEVNFLAPLKAGDIVEVTAEATHIGDRSRQIAFGAHVLARAAEGAASSGRVLESPLEIATATGTVVVPTAGITA